MPPTYTEVDGGRRLIGRETARPIGGPDDAMLLANAIAVTLLEILDGVADGYVPIYGPRSAITVARDTRKRDGRGARGNRWFVSIVFQKSSHERVDDARMTEESSHE